ESRGGWGEEREHTTSVRLYHFQGGECGFFSVSNRTVAKRGSGIHSWDDRLRKALEEQEQDHQTASTVRAIAYHGARTELRRSQERLLPQLPSGVGNLVANLIQTVQLLTVRSRASTTREWTARARPVSM
ncbi:unnamed protein product, partial [Amoebophrya sp. A25]